jgi:lipooligosaccharide transport system permease protein
VSTVIRGWQDFDVVVTAQTALFLFSGTFTPIAKYPEAIRVLVEVTPLFHGVELVRGLALGDIRLALLWDTGYLLAMLAAGLAFSYWRIEKTLRR